MSHLTETPETMAEAVQARGPAVVYSPGFFAPSVATGVPSALESDRALMAHSLTTQALVVEPETNLATRLSTETGTDHDAPPAEGSWQARVRSPGGKSLEKPADAPSADTPSPIPLPGLDAIQPLLARYGRALSAISNLDSVGPMGVEGVFNRVDNLGPNACLSWEERFEKAHAQVDAAMVR